VHIPVITVCAPAHRCTSLRFFLNSVFNCFYIPLNYASPHQQSLQLLEADRLSGRLSVIGVMLQTAATPGAPPEEAITDRNGDPVGRPWIVPESHGTHSSDMSLGSDSKGSENIPVRSECSPGPAR